MRKKKSPPSGLPKTQAELEHIRTEANNEGAAHALEILLYVLADKFGWGAYDLQGLMARVVDQAQAISTGMTATAFQMIVRAGSSTRATPPFTTFGVC